MILKTFIYLRIFITSEDEYCILEWMVVILMYSKFALLNTEQLMLTSMNSQSL